MLLILNTLKLIKSGYSQVYHPILPLRLLMTMRRDEAKARLADLFMDHEDERRK